MKIAFAGRPNVGKSSLINALLGEDRVIVSDIPGTTRDAIDVEFKLHYGDADRDAVLIDTAGLRRKGKIHDAVELFSMMRSQKAIERADLVLFVLEAGLGNVTAQDRRIAGDIERANKACIIVANKYDLAADDAKEKVLLEDLRHDFPLLDYAPVIFTSAKTRRNLPRLLDAIAQVAEQMELRLSTGLVNRVLLDAMEQVSPPVVGLNPLKLYYAAMVGQAPPHFVLFVNQTANCAPNYLRYLRNALRAAFDLTGLPLVLELRNRPKKVTSFHSADRPSYTPYNAKKASSGAKSRSGNSRKRSSSGRKRSR